MAQNSGFFDALYSNGEYDRTYSSADYCDNLATVIKNGVRYSADDDLKVTSENANMYLTVGIGRAWINGHYYYNDSAYSGLLIATAPVGNTSRIDRVVLRLNTAVAGRSISLFIKQGTAAQSPVAPELTRAGDIYEIALADVLVSAGTTAITAAMITDQRANGTVCGWAASVTPAIMSMLQKYQWTQVLEANAVNVTFDIPQYDAQDVHILEVYTNGVLETLGTDYTLSGITITFASTRQSGAEIKVILYKSIDGTGLESAADQLAAMQVQIDNLGSVNNIVYQCTGTDDNIALSNIAAEFFAGGNDYSSLKIDVVGQLGCATAFGGAGTSISPFRWFTLGTEAASNRKLIFDFSTCNQISVLCPADSYNTIFHGINVDIIGARVVGLNGALINVFSPIAAATIRAQRCYFDITANACGIAKSGRFDDCSAILVNMVAGQAAAFDVGGLSLLRLNGGEYRCYAPTGSASAIVKVGSGMGAAVIDAINCPTVARTGYQQTFCIQATGGWVTMSHALTPLTITVPNNALIRDTLAISKPNMF